MSDNKWWSLDLAWPPASWVIPDIPVCGTANCLLRRDGTESQKNRTPASGTCLSSSLVTRPTGTTDNSVTTKRRGIGGVMRREWTAGWGWCSCMRSFRGWSHVGLCKGLMRRDYLFILFFLLFFLSELMLAGVKSIMSRDLIMHA